MFLQQNGVTVANLLKSLKKKVFGPEVTTPSKVTKDRHIRSTPGTKARDRVAAPDHSCFVHIRYWDSSEELM